MRTISLEELAARLEASGIGGPVPIPAPAREKEVGEVRGGIGKKLVALAIQRLHVLAEMLPRQLPYPFPQKVTSE